MKYPPNMKKTSPPRATVLYLILLAGLILLCFISLIFHKTASLLGCCFWMVFLLLFYLSRPDSDLHMVLHNKNLYENTLILLMAVLTIICCLKPMSLSPIWNGEIPDHRNQYELLAESFLDGRLYIEYGDEAELLKLENPYDPVERRESGVSYHWDHAYYNGRYYMYFGVVPVLLVFLPYRVITGTALTTYHVTQLFAAGIILGFFVLFRMLTRLFFKKMSLGMYLFLSVAFSVISVWFSTAEPALYCTAITAGICMQLWSILFFCKAVWDCKEENQQLRFAFIGSLLGALTFGCRPPVGLANIVALPLVVAFIKQRKPTPKLIGKLILAALPYVIVAAGLMAYNYVRFDDPFEFGQSYQLTTVDQRDLFESVTLIHVINHVMRNLFDYYPMSEEFPHIAHSGVLFNFPIFLCIYSGFLPHVREDIQKKKLGPFLLSLLLAVIAIAITDAIGSPSLLERYRMDIYFLFSILCFLLIGLWHETFDTAGQKKFSCLIMHLAVLMILSAIFHFLYEAKPHLKDFVAGMESVIFFWRSL